MAKENKRAKNLRHPIAGSREAVETAIDSTKSGAKTTWEQSAAKSHSIPSWTEKAARESHRKKA